MMFFRRRNKLVQEDVQKVIKWVIAEDVFLGKLERQLTPLLDSIIKQGTSLRGVRGAVGRVGRVEIRLDDNIKDLLFKVNKQDWVRFDSNSKKAIDKLVTRIEIERATLLRDLSRYTGKISQLYNDLDRQLLEKKYDDMVKTATLIKSVIEAEREQCRALIADLESIGEEITASKALQRAELDKIVKYPDKIAFLIAHIREISISTDVLRKIRLQNALEMWVSTIDRYIADDRFNYDKLVKAVTDVEHINYVKSSSYYAFHNSITAERCPYLFQNLKYVGEWKKQTKFKQFVEGRSVAENYVRISVARFSIILSICGLYEAASMLLVKFIDGSDLASADTVNAQDLLIDTLGIAKASHVRFALIDYYYARWNEVSGDRFILISGGIQDLSSLEKIVSLFRTALDLYASVDYDDGYSRVGKKLVMVVLEYSKRDAGKVFVLDETYKPFSFLRDPMKMSYWFTSAKVWSIILAAWKKVPSAHPLNIAQLYELTGDFEKASLLYDSVLVIDEKRIVARKERTLKKMKQFTSSFSLDLIDDLLPSQQITFILIAISKNKNILVEGDTGETKLEKEKDYLKITKLLLSKVVDNDDAESILSTYKERNIPFDSVWLLLGKGFEKKNLFACAGHCFVHIKDWKRASRCFHHVDPTYAQLLLSGQRATVRFRDAS